MLRRLATYSSRALSKSAPLRFLNIHEGDAKTLLAQAGVDIQHGEIVTDLNTIPDVCSRLREKYHTTNYIVKAQILAGGRGKGTFTNGFKGGVKFCKTVEDAQAAATAMLGNRLVTIQTSPEGAEVKKIYIAECLDIAKEMYFALLLDRGNRCASLIGSSEGGVDIETTAKERPDAIKKLPLHIRKVDGEFRLFPHAPTSPKASLDQPFDMDAVDSFALGLGLEADLLPSARSFITNIMQFAISRDVTQCEVNPLVVTEDNRVVAVDAKVNFDDSAEFRQQDAFALADESESDPREVKAAKWDLNYVGLDGNIGCLVNGAGLAMSTMDIIKLKGGEPANFLDVGGTATKERVAAAFEIITEDPRVKAILVNVFGGIIDCSMIARGVMGAIEQTGLKVPVVVRLSGFNADLGRKLLADAAIPGLHAANDLDDASTKVVSLL